MLNDHCHRVSTHLQSINIIIIIIIIVIIIIIIITWMWSSYSRSGRFTVEEEISVP